MVAGGSALARSQTRAYWLAWIATLVFFAGFYALLVPLPRYLAEAGLLDWQIGLVLGAFGVASLLGRPVAGVATDRFGPRRVMLVGAASLAIGALGVPGTTSVAVLFVLRILQAIGYVAFTTAGTALVVTLVAPEERGRRLAVFGAAANLSISLTPAAINALLAVAPLEAGLAASGAFALVGGILAVLLPPRSNASDPPPRIEWAIPRRLWLPMLAAGLFGAGFAGFVQFVPIVAERRGIEPGPLYTVYGISIIVTRLTGGRLLDRYDIAGVVAVGAVLMALGHALIATTEGFLPMAVAAGLIASSGGLFHPALIARHATLLPEAPGRATAAFYVAFDLGIGLGSWLFGVALQIAGPTGLAWTATALAGLVLPVAPLLRSRRPAPDIP